MIFFIGANLDFANTKLQLILSLLFMCRALLGAPFLKYLPANMCNSIGFAEKHLHQPPILTLFESFMLISKYTNAMDSLAILDCLAVLTLPKSSS